MYKQTNLHDALPKFLNGDELSDTELADVLRFYSEAIITLDILADTNQAYEFARKDVRQILERLRSFSNARRRIRARSAGDDVTDDSGHYLGPTTTVHVQNKSNKS